MARLFSSDSSAQTTIQSASAQIIVSGGHGGLVTYDGKGGPMIKEGGPMDRLFFLRNDGLLVGDAGLDIPYGHINIRTGKLQKDVKLYQEKSGDCVAFDFENVDDDNAFEIRGEIRELGLPKHTLLISGNIAQSQMIWETNSKTGREGTLPYVAFHPRVHVHPEILKWFEAGDLKIIGGDTGWCKVSPAQMDISMLSKKGVGFRTQQHLGHLRVFLGKNG